MGRKTTNLGMYKLRLNKWVHIIFIGSLLATGYACSHSHEYATPEEFKCISHADTVTYHRDSIALDSMIQPLLDSNDQAFYPNYYDQDTKFRIPEILYSPEGDKFIFFVVTHLPKEKQHNKKHERFIGLFFIGEKDSTRNIKRINWESLLRYSTYGGYNEAWKGVRSMYYELSGIRNTYGESLYGFNIDDIRFWECKIWEKEYIYNNDPIILE